MTNHNRTIPPGWRWVKLGDVCHHDRRIVVSGSIETSCTYLSLEHIESNTGRILRDPLSVVNDEGISSTFLFDTRHVLYGKLRPYLNKVALPDFKGRCTTELIPLLPIKIDRQFLAWVLRREETVDFAMRGKTGSRMPRANMGEFFNLEIPLPPLPEQQRITAILNEQLTAIERACVAVEGQLDLTNHLIVSYLRQSLSTEPTQTMQLKDCLLEIKQGVGEGWKQYPVIGATRAGVAPAKENVGKQPERYKLVEPGIIFYNPMRINIGSIGMLDEGDLPGITSPDYVVFKTLPGVLHYRWFYYWFRSPYGEAFIKTMARGAVRERIMFNRLAMGEIEAPSWDIQGQIAEKLRKTEDMRRAIFEQIEVINAFPKLLLRRAFNGEL